LKEIFKQHKRWINIVKQLGIDDYAEDIVQEAYLKCLEKKSINEAYFYLTLRSLAFDLHRKQKKIIKVPIEEINISIEIDKENEVFEIVDRLHWFDKQVFYLYYDNKLSMRKIAKETGISLSTIFNTISKCNDKILKEWEEKRKQ
jgi:RNA polymerase sigma factor (sigma-70 family)